MPEETEPERLPTLQEYLVETGARLLRVGLEEHALLPLAFLHLESVVMQICREVEQEWLHDTLGIMLYREALKEVRCRLQAIEHGATQQEATTTRREI